MGTTIESDWECTRLKEELETERNAFESDIDTLAQHNIELQQENARLRALLYACLEAAGNSCNGIYDEVREALK